MGRGILALKNIAAGSVLFEERPMVSVIHDDVLGKYCSYCYNPVLEAPPKSSSKEITPQESSGAIVKDEVTDHTKRTKLAKQGVIEKWEAFHDDCVDLATRDLAIHYAGVRNKDYTHEFGNFPILSRILMAHTLEHSLKQLPTLWQGILGSLCFAQNFQVDRRPYDNWVDFVVKKFDNLNKEAVEKITPFAMYERVMRICQLNAMNVTYHVKGTNKTEDVCTALFGLGSFFNHSCEPNTELKPSMEEKSGFGSFVTRADVKEGEQLCIAYCGLTDAVEDRQTHLEWYYAFKCQCPKCIRERGGVVTPNKQEGA